METQVLIKLSAIIDKLDLKDELKKLEVKTDNEEKDNEELGKQLIMLFISKIYKAEEEVYELISIYKKIDIEQAKKENIIPIIKEIMNVDGIKSFLA